MFRRLLVWLGVAWGMVGMRLDAQGLQWTPLKGTFDLEIAEIPGTRGVPDSLNQPGERADVASWTGPDGMIYLHGGWGDGGHYNDLWRHDPVNALWTWMSGTKLGMQLASYGTLGVEDPANNPGNRSGAVTWKGDDGQFYLYGGHYYDYTNLNEPKAPHDLWRYNSATNGWTWLSGDDLPQTYDPAQFPPPKSAPATWTGADGRLYLFGGLHENDLWAYDLQSNAWTRLHETGPAEYGQLGVAAATNRPPSRAEAISWTGADGQLYLFGGYNQLGSLHQLNYYYSDLWRYNPTTNQWTWISGGTTENQAAIYGERKQSGPANTPGGRSGSAAWTGSNGRLYLFGGCAAIGWPPFGMWFNDLWSYDTATHQWTWVSGSPLTNQTGVYGTRNTFSAGAIPGARADVGAWTSSDGRLYLFGGVGFDETSTSPDQLNDLWVYDPQADQWAWLGGRRSNYPLVHYGAPGEASPENLPGGRWHAASWTAPDGRLYFFGGEFKRNDLWCYDPVINQWAFMLGSQLSLQDSVAGARGVSAPGNLPCGRDGASTWTGPDGNLYLFGGQGAFTDRSDFVGDMWRYSPILNQWTWLTGNLESHQAGVYGIQGQPAAANTPGSRRGAVTWTGPDGVLYLFGGYGLGSDAGGPFPNRSVIGFLNDLWRYDVTTNQWTWLKGSDVVNPAGSYGDQGIFSTGNTPPGRANAASWTGPDGRLYLFGGAGREANLFDDLWCFDPQTAEWTWLKGSSGAAFPINHGLRGVANPANHPGPRSEACAWTGSDGNLYLFGGGTAWGFNLDQSLSQLQRPLATSHPITASTDVTLEPLFNDLWRYDIASNTWTWVAGDDTWDKPGVWGGLGIAAPANRPGARRGAIAWSDTNGNVYLYGGNGIDCGTNRGILDDLWRLTPAVSACVRWMDYQ